MRNQKGILGFRPLLILAIIGGLVIWAYYKGYLKWKGPKPEAVAEEMKDDVRGSVKKLAK